MKARTLSIQSELFDVLDFFQKALDRSRLVEIKCRCAVHSRHARNLRKLLVFEAITLTANATGLQGPRISQRLRFSRARQSRSPSDNTRARSLVGPRKAH